MICDMNDRTWLIEMELAACIWAAAIVAFALMIGYCLWKGLAGK
jgi:hypothetical protein